MARLAIGADEKKKLYVLGGLLAAIVVVGVVVFVPRGASTTTTTTTGTTPIPTPGAVKPPGAPGAAPTVAAAPGTANAASLVSVSNFRDDPFTPFARPPLPPIPQGSNKDPLAPVMIPSPEAVGIAPPNQGNSGDYSGGPGLPPMSIGGQTSARPISDLPPISLPARPNIPTTPGPTGGQGSGGVAESPNKRVSGVIIGDSVRALLEITDGDTKTTRIVQPGDEVDGIRILRIERITVGGRPITRLIIRENGEERSVVLKAGPREATTTGAGGRTPRP